MFNRNLNEGGFSEELANLKAIYAEELIKEQQLAGTSKYTSPQLLRDKINSEMNKMGQDLLSRLSKGTQVLIENLNRLAEENPEKFDPVHLEELNKIEKKKDLIADQGVDQEESEELPSIKEICGISDKAFNCYMDVAQELMESNKFQEAADLLFYLSIVNYKNPLTLLSLGCAEYQLQNYEAAKVAFEMAAIQSPANPEVYLYDAHCYENLNDYDHAQELVEYALQVMGENPEFTDLIEDAKIYLKELQKVNK